MIRNRGRRGFSGWSWMIILLPALFLNPGCGNTRADTVEIQLADLDPMVVLPPDYPATLQGSTLVVQGYSGAPTIHSYPIYAGVNNPSELGIGSAAGFDSGDSLTLPINADLGDKKLKSYKFLLIIDQPNLLQLKRISGNNTDLADKYPLQYDPAKGFSFPPTVALGATAGYLYITSLGTSTATGRINLDELDFRLLKRVPDSGISVEFQVVELLDDADADLCSQFVAGCRPKSGIISRNFRIEQ